MMVRRSATHPKPDADAIAATWLARAYHLFGGEDIEGRGREISEGLLLPGSVGGSHDSLQ